MVVKGPESIVKQRLLNQLRKAKKPVWKRVREILLQPKRREVEVNLRKLGKVTKKDDVVVVPGKILAVGSLDHPITLAYVDASKAALKGLEASKSKVMPLQKFLENDAEQKNIKIVI